MLKGLNHSVLLRQLFSPTTLHQRTLHGSQVLQEIKKWPDQNKWVYPPQKPGEAPRPAWVCHYRANIKYSPETMHYIATLIRGMSIDEAIKQLTFLRKKGAVIAKEVLLEAQELAVKEHNVEYKTNLWVAESNVRGSIIIKGMRKHAKMRFGIIHYRYCNYFVRLVEGPPPKYFYKNWTTGDEKLEQYFQELRARRIHRTL